MTTRQIWYPWGGDGSKTKNDNRGASDISTAKSSGEDPRATAVLVSNLPHPRVYKTKSHSPSFKKGRKKKVCNLDLYPQMEQL